MKRTAKRLWPAATALEVARELCGLLKPHCLRLVVAGSLRRRRPEVRDLEILYIGRTADVSVPEDLFARRLANQADDAIADMEARGILQRRTSAYGRICYGPKNKMMRHTATGMPVDFFSTTEACWFNALVCRTGSAETNTRIATEALQRGYRWNPYGPGFTCRDTGEVIAMRSEEEVFRFVGLPFLPPDAR